MLNFSKKKPNLPTRIEAISDEDGNPSLVLRQDIEVTGKDSVGLLEMASEHSKIPIFKGQVEHLYESDFTGYKDKCPRCQAEVVRMFSNFAYATQVKSRLMTAPAGLFCQSCPTVIIDDDMVRANIDHSRFEYWGVFAVEDGYSSVKPIETLNGVTPTFILDEVESTIGGILQSVHQPEGGEFFDPKMQKTLGGGSANKMRPEVVNALRKQKAKKKARNKNAKQSKKANRKK